MDIAQRLNTCLTAACATQPELRSHLVVLLKYAVDDSPTRESVYQQAADWALHQNATVTANQWGVSLATILEMLRMLHRCLQDEAKPMVVAYAVLQLPAGDRVFLYGLDRCVQAKALHCALCHADATVCCPRCLCAWDCSQACLSTAATEHRNFCLLPSLEQNLARR